MRIPRVKYHERTSVHHLICRCTAGDILFDDEDKEMLRSQLEQMADFCGIEVLAYVFMGNHYHLLVRVPELAARDGLSQEVLLQRLGILRGPRVRKELLAELESGSAELVDHARQVLARHRALMGDVSQFMKLYKMRFTRWYNPRHGRFGTLWAERFKSLLVEDSPEAVQAVAAYIDLNPVRSGICNDPKDYPFCSYAEAVAKEGMARSGLKSVFRVENGDGKMVNGFSLERWDKVQARYRRLIFGTVSLTGKKKADGTLPAPKVRKDIPRVSMAKVREVQKSGGELGLIAVMRHPVRYFSQGVAFGSEEFVEGVFTSRREAFAVNRKSGARKLRGGIGGLLGELRTLRDFRD